MEMVTYLDSPIAKFNLKERCGGLLDQLADFIFSSDRKALAIQEEYTEHETCVFKLHPDNRCLSEVRGVIEECSTLFLLEFLPDVFTSGKFSLELRSELNNIDSWHGFTTHRHRPPFLMTHADFTMVLYPEIKRPTGPNDGSLWLWGVGEHKDHYDDLVIPPTIKPDMELFPTKYDLVLFTSDIWHKANRPLTRSNDTRERAALVIDVRIVYE